MPKTESSKNIVVRLDDLSIQDEDYHVSDDEYVVPGEDDDESDPENPVIHTIFDLFAFDNASTRIPVFTRGMIRCVSTDVNEILSKQSKSARKCKRDSVSRPHPNGQRVYIWKSNERHTNNVTIQYSTRVEMCAEFQRRFGNVWQRSKDLRKWNDHMPERLLNELRVPYYLTTSLRLYRSNYLDDAWMKEMRTRLRRTHEIWDTSNSCTQLLDLVRTNAWRLENPITKIICFGLGRLDPSPTWYGSTLQHLAVFSMADTLDAVNQERFPTTPLIKVIAQDPNYETADHTLLRELTSTPIVFDNTEPKTLLAIDGNTLVVTAFLPTTVPLMQIIADMFADGKEKGPGMIICDQMKGLSVEKRMYTLRFHRDAPHVARFLLRGYIKQEDFMNWDEALKEDSVGKLDMKNYWLPRMEFWVRNDVMT
jgi:hypothetical protein